VSAAGTFANRFFLHFIDKNLIPEKEFTSVSEKEIAQNFTMFTVDGVIKVTSTQHQSGKIAVYDLLGHKIAAGRVDAGASTQIDMQGKTGVYIVSVLSGKGISNKKILVK